MPSLFREQRGFAAIELILIVVAVVGIGYVGYQAWVQQKVAFVPAPTPTPVQYLLIPEQSVRLPLTPALSKLTHGPLKSSGYSSKDQSVAVLAPQLDAGWTCAPDEDGNRGTIGAISITTEEKRSGPGDPAVSV